MSLKKSRFIKGIILAPDNAALDGIEGEIKVDSSTGKIQVTLKDGVNPSASREIVTSSQTQILTNKTLTSPVLDTGVSGSAIDIDGTLTANSDTKLASQKAVKTYVDAAVASKDQASEISYSNATSGLVATNVQTAIDEVDGNVDNLVTLSGVALDSTTLGTFTGTTIPDSSTIKSAIQSLETSHESHTGASSGVHGVAGSVVGTSDSQALTNKTIDADLNTISNIENADIKVGAAIARAKLASGTANRIVINDATGVQVDAAAITASRALVSDANGIPTHSSTTSTEIGHLSGVTSAIQTQLDGKVDESGGTLTSGSVITPARLDVKQGTKASLTTYALTATNGQIVYATDTKEMFQVIDGLLEGIGGGEGVGGTDILFAQTFETAALTDFTQTGLSLSTSNPLHGEISALLTHDASVNQLFKQVIPVDNKFRNQTMVLRLDVKSNASAGNVVINIYDETNAANIVASEQLQLSNDVNGTKNSVGFTIPETCASISYTITALPEAGSPVTRIDDIICELAVTALLETVVELTGNAQTLTIPLTQSGLVQEGDSFLKAAGNAGQSITVNVTDIPFIAISNQGSDISFNGSSVTALSDGVYSFDVGLLFTASLARRISVYVNGTNTYETASATDTSLTSNITLKLNEGDIVKFRVSGNGGTLNNAPQFHYLNVTKQGSLKQIAVSSDQKLRIPTSELRMEGASARGSTDTAIVRFDTIAKIRGDAFTVESDSVLGTRITMKKAGKLDVQATVTVGASFTFGISKNQTIRTSTPTVAECIAVQSNASTFNSSVAGSTYVQVGDIIRVSSSGNPSGANFLTLAFQEQDISVSVTNTLPQFSESDSSVRVTGGNGFTGQTRLFSNVIQNIGNDVQYTAASGQFRAMSSGIYNITYQEESSVSSTSYEIYVYVNETLIAIANDRINTAATLTRYPIASIQLYLSEGDIVTGRVSATGSFPSVSSYSSMTISKVGKPNVTGVDVTPFVNVPQPKLQYLNYSGLQSGLLNRGDNVTTHGIKFAPASFTYSGLDPIYFDNTANTENATRFYARTRCEVTFTAYGNGTTTNRFDIYKNSTVIMSSDPTAAKDVSASTTLEAGEYLYLSIPGSTGLSNDANTIYVTISGIGLSDQILTAPETFSTDTASLTYANIATYTPSTLANAPVGTYITFTYAGGGNARSQTTGLNRPTQTDADMNANGILLYTRVFSVGSSSSQPAAIAIQIGKGMKGKTIDLYKSAGKLISGSIDSIHVGTDTQRGLAFQSYDEKTGILYLDAGLNLNGSATTDNKFIFNDNLTQTSGYLVINASKNPALTGLNVLLPRIAVLTGINAATPVASTYVTRTLNTLNDPTAIVTSLASNQFTLTAGTYSIMASATHHRTNSASSRIRNITDGTSAISGIASYASNASVTGFVDNLSGIVTINSTKTFELQSIAESSASASYGIAAGSDYVNAQVTIQKIK